MRFAANDSHSVASDQEFLVRRNRIGEQFGILSRNYAFAADRFLILHSVNAKPCPFHSFANPRSYIR